MREEKSVNGKVLVIGSSSSVALAISQIKDNTIFLGRTNPNHLKNWLAIPSQETKAGIDECVKILKEQLSKLNSSKEVHLICLQGISTNDWEMSINVNLLSVALLSEAFCEFIENNKITGSVTLIGTATSYFGGKPTYASTKAALFGLMNSLQSQHIGVRVNLVLPGAFVGGMTDDWDDAKKKRIAMESNAKRLATSSEIAHAINFCIDNKYLSQSVLNMTSGRVVTA